MALENAEAYNALLEGEAKKRYNMWLAINSFIQSMLTYKYACGLITESESVLSNETCPVPIVTD